MKQFLKYLILQIIFLFNTLLLAQELEQENFLKYQRFFKEYKFKIYSAHKEVGYVNIKISSFSQISDNFCSEIESYMDIPILFFIGNTENYEIEHYDFNFIPIKSSLITFEGKKEIITSMDVVKEEKDYRCYFVKKNKRIKEKEVIFNPPILTPGNIIPLVTTLWDFENQKEIEFNFIDKDRLKIDVIKLYFLGQSANGLYKIKIVLPYFKAKFIIYLDREKNIKYAEGLGLKIYSVE